MIEGSRYGLFSGLLTEGLGGAAPLPFFDGGRNGFTNSRAVTAIPALILARFVDREITTLADWANVVPLLLCRSKLIEVVVNIKFPKFR